MSSQNELVWYSFYIRVVDILSNSSWNGYYWYFSLTRYLWYRQSSYIIPRNKYSTKYTLFNANVIRPFKMVRKFNTFIFKMLLTIKLNYLSLNRFPINGWKNISILKRKCIENEVFNIFLFDGIWCWHNVYSFETVRFTLTEGKYWYKLIIIIDSDCVSLKRP